MYCIPLVCLYGFLHRTLRCHSFGNLHTISDYCNVIDFKKRALIITLYLKKKKIYRYLLNVL